MNVKPLRWSERPGLTGCHFTQPNVLGVQYFVCREFNLDTNQYLNTFEVWIDSLGFSEKGFMFVDEAKAAAQENYKQRVLSQLEID